MAYKIPCALVAILFVTAATRAAPAASTAPDPARGRVLYEQHCQVCHTPGIHARQHKLPLTRDELRALVDFFRRQASLGWTREEIEDVVEHLDRTHYHFAPDKPRSSTR